MCNGISDGVFPLFLTTLLAIQSDPPIVLNGWLPLAVCQIKFGSQLGAHWTLKSRFRLTASWRVQVYDISRHYVWFVCTNEVIPWTRRVPSLMNLPP